MNRQVRSGSWCSHWSAVRWTVLVAMLAAACPSLASAQRGTLDTYIAAPTPEDDFQLARPTGLGHLRFGAILHLDYGLNPLVWEDRRGDATTERLPVVEHQLVGTVGLSFGLIDRIVIFGGLPVNLAMTGADEMTVTGLGPRASDGFTAGNVYLGARVRLFGEEDDAFALGLQATFYFPTSTGQYSGDQGLAALPMLSAEIRPGAGVRFVLNAGAFIREDSAQALTNVVFSSELRLGAGVVVPVWTDTDPRSHFDLLAQINAGSAFRDFFGRDGTHAEVLGGIRFAHASGIVIGAEAGPGIARGIGTPDVRAVLTLGWVTPRELEQPPPPDPCADTPEDLDGFEDDDGCDDPDNDADGILDGVDACPNEPENFNEWEDTDGCPDVIPDTDGDGLLDPQDECPTEPEDRDSFQDEDGCPDLDNDGDGVVDTSDQCPLEAGVVENRGCPDRDRDEDTVVDRRDNCPDVPGVPENFGCPATQRQSVRLEDGAIEILDTVYFRTDSDVILRRSFSLLDNVVSVLQNHPEIEHIRVEGHTDSRGGRDHNMDLSRRRAASVVTYLTAHGIDAGRLESAGFGPDEPVVPDAHTPAEHARNRRVVFRILGGPGEVSSTTSGPSAEHIDR